jgi:flotillin
MRGIERISVVDTGSGSGAARVSNYVTELMATSSEMLRNTSGIDVESMIRGLVSQRKPGITIEEANGTPLNTEE